MNDQVEDAYVQKLSKCPEYIQAMHDNLHDYLLSLPNVATEVVPSGPGRNYLKDGRNFCRMDPKPRTQWIGIRIWRVEKDIIETVESVRNRREKSWIHLKDPAKVEPLKAVLQIAHNCI